MTHELNEFLGNDRKQFEKNELLENNTPAAPFELFNLWLQQAIEHKLTEPYAMILATSAGNMPSQRVVYLREIYEDGYGFFTNYLSKKGIDLAKNPNASLLFFWPDIERQIRLEGTIRVASKEISDNYFSGRPRNSQLGAWASEQSKIIASREILNERMKEFENKFPSTVPRPEHWGGYIFEPSYFEFWQGRSSRLHDRICYEKNGTEWKKFRKAP
ncbi:MAG TPA: pyridoxamine 5'-phosphate oxidase [Flavobacteriales bacterium]|nr:pyridoxamine 5'-phosphate oxidase [Flavobacteriales bacterium]